MASALAFLITACDGAPPMPDRGARDAARTSDAGRSPSDAALAADAGVVRTDAGNPAIGVTPGGPVLFFSDLTSGARSGNSDDSHGQSAGIDGFLVTVWGKNLGETQGASSITVGGATARVYSWGPAIHGADLHTRMGLQSIELQVPGEAPLGEAPIQVVVGGVASNELAFRTRDVGRAYYAAPGGSDRGDGSFQTPFATLDAAIEAMDDGDVVYGIDGLLANTPAGDLGFLNLRFSGTRELPRAVVAYPGATVTIGTDCEPTGHALVSPYSYLLDAYTSDWVISKLRVVSPPTCDQDMAIGLGDGFRLVGTFISNARTWDGCQTGSVTCGGLGGCGDDLYILGNEMTGVMTGNRDTGSKQCHGFYLSGSRTSDGVETYRELGWNYIHDNATNRGINIYNESYDGVHRAQIEGHRIHDNWMENQRGVGMLLGREVTGENWIYNNIFVHCGLGPEFPDGGAFWPWQMNPGSSVSSRPTTVYVHNNLVYGDSFPELLTRQPDYYWGIGLVSIDQNEGTPVTFDIRNNILVSTLGGVGYVSTGSSAFDGANNLWFGAGSGPASHRASLSVDPGFVNPSQADFHLRPDSPARGAGVPVPDAPLDFDGIPRSAGGWSLGPYQ